MTKSPKKFPKYLKYIFFGLIIILSFLLVSTTILFKTSFGKRQTAKIIANFVESKIESKVTIGSSSFKLNYLTLNDLIIYDTRDTVALSINEVKLNFRKFRQIPGKIKFSEAILDGVLFNGVQHEPGEYFNFQYLIQKMKDKSKPGNDPKKIVFQNIKMKNGTFNLRKANEREYPGKIDFADFSWKNITTEIEDLTVFEKRIEAKVLSLSTMEKTGFEVKDFQTDFALDTFEIYFHNSRLITPGSKYVGDITFNFNDLEELKYFVENVEMDYQVDTSELAIEELAYFSREFKSNLEKINLSGHVYGKLGNLSSKDVHLQFGKQSNFYGRIEMNGLPEVSETFFDVVFDEAYFTMRDLHNLIPSINFPEYFYNTGFMQANISYTGFMNDFVAFGNIETYLGTIESDINFKIPYNDIPKYSGNLELKNFDLGQMLNNDRLGKTSLRGTVNGQGLKVDNASSTIDIKSEYLEFNGYTYKNASFNGLLAKRIFNGEAKVSDKNVNLDFNGKIDLTKEKPYYKFKANLKNTDLFALNFVTDTLIVSSYFDINLKVKDIDDIEGTVLLLNSNIHASYEDYQINTMVLTSKPKGNVKNIKVKSELADATMSGYFEFSELGEYFKSSIAPYMDSTFKLVRSDKYDNYYLDLDVDLKKTSFLNKVLKTGMFFDDNTHLSGSFRKENDFIRLNCSVPGFYYKDIELKNLLLSANTSGGNLLSYSSLNQLVYKDSTLLKNLNLSFSANRDSINFESYSYNSRYKLHFTLNGDLFLEKDSLAVLFRNSNLVSKGEKWHFDTEKILVNYTPEIYIPALNLSQGRKSLRLFGKISKSSKDPIRVLIDDVYVEDISKYVPFNIRDFSGKMNGQIVIYDILEDPYFDATLVSNPLIYNSEDTLGILSLQAVHNYKTSNTNLLGGLMNENLDPILNIDGYVDFIAKNEIDLGLSIPKTDFKNYEGFLSNLFSDLTGKIKGELNFKGPLENYKINGFLEMYNAGLTFDYMKTRYYIYDRVTLDEKTIFVKDVELTDDYGNKALMNGYVDHNHFRDFYFNLGLKVNNLAGLNTTEDDNTVYYGKAFATGDVAITGPLELMNVDLILKPEKNTEINIIAYDDNTFGNYNFIRFTYKDEIRDYTHKANIEGVSVNLEVEMNPNAEVNVIFDPETNDIISANGNGNIKIKVDNLGNTFMLGKYEISEGNYTFKITDFIKKHFTISEGSSILWKGDPFEAEANIEAVYHVPDVSIKELMANSVTQETQNDYNQGVPVDAKMYLTGNIFEQPNIDLDFEIIQEQSVGNTQFSEVDNQVRLIKNDKQELNKQVISLLALGSFFPTNTGQGTGSVLNNTVNSNIGSLISSQFSQWVNQVAQSFDSKYLENLQIGMDYSPQNENYQQELIFILDYSLLDDRIQFSGAYDVENINANFQVNYRITEDGNVNMKVFSRSDNNPIYHEDITKQGLGILYRNEFEKFSDIVKLKKK